MTDEKDNDNKVVYSFGKRLQEKQKKLPYCAVGDALDDLVSKEDYKGFLRVIEALRSMADSISIHVEGYEHVAIEATMFYNLGEPMDEGADIEDTVMRTVSGNQIVSFIFPEYEFDEKEDSIDGDEYAEILDDTSDKMKQAVYGLFSQWSVIGSPGTVEDNDDDI